MLLTVIVEVPLFAIVNVPCADDPAATFPNARLPLNETMRVGGGVGVTVKFTEAIALSLKPFLNALALTGAELVSVSGVPV